MKINSVKLILIITVIYSNKMCCEDQKHEHTKEKWMHYVLLWSSTTESSTFIKNLGQGADTFIKRRCPFQNCFITDDKTYLNEISDFDAVLFVGTPSFVPSVRSDDQKYIFVGIESAYDSPVSEEFNSFFNWTWTYKLDSDIPLWHFVVRNKNNEVIGPETDMDWMKSTDMKPINNRIKRKLRKKSIAAAWFASRCKTSSKREDFIHELQKELLKEYNLELRIFGLCGEYSCEIENNEYCLSKVESDYYFYLAFERSLSEDFITERVVDALQHYSVPIVYGGANYSRFLPSGSYIDANELSPDQLAKIMHAVITDEEKYYKFFRWHRYYSFHHTIESPETDGFCALCALLNDQNRKEERSSYTQFVRWWNEPLNWPKEWFNGRYEAKLTTKYKLASNASKQRAKVLIKNPESLIPKIYNNDVIDESESIQDTFTSMFSSIIEHYFYSK